MRRPTTRCVWAQGDTRLIDSLVGDPVFGVTDQGVEGAYAALKVAIIARKPNRLSHAEAAALGL